MLRRFQKSACQRRDLWIKTSSFNLLSNVLVPENINIHYCAGKCYVSGLREQIFYEYSKNNKLKLKFEDRCCVPFSKQFVWLKNGNLTELNDLVVEKCHCVPEFK